MSTRFVSSLGAALKLACAIGAIPMFAVSVARAAPVPLSTPYAQSFDVLASSGVAVPFVEDSTLPAWYASRTTYNAAAGASNTGSLYSFGTASSTDRALGGVASGGTATITFGVRLVNDTASTITSVAVQYAGEQWREGGGTTASLAQKLDFATKTTAADLAGGAFVDVDALDFVSPSFGATTASALDGNASANRSTVSGSITGLSVAPGQVLWLQWSDLNDTGNDHGLGIDDLTVVVTGTSGGGGGGDPCTETDTPIGVVQGAGASAAVTGITTVQGVVVGDYEGPSPRLRGFYLQDAADADPATSNAIFVFNGDADAVSVGDEVQITGSVAEFQGQTQLSAVSSIELCGSGRTVAPVPVQLPVPSPDYLERYEGMLVSFNQPLYVTELFQLGRFGQVTVSSGGRLFQPTNVASPGAAAASVQAQNDRQRIIIDDALQSQNPDPIVFGRGGLPLSASNTLRGGDSVTGLRGVLTYTWAGNAASGNAYRVRPVGALGAVLPNFVAENPRPTVAPPVGGNLKLSSFNVLNYFNTFGTTSCSFGVGGAAAECRGAGSSAEFERQAAKTVAALAALDADVVAIIEVENDGYGSLSAIRDLVDRLNARVGAGTYAYIDFDARVARTNAGGTDAIKNGLLYKQALLTPVADGTYADANPIHNRAPLAQTFQTAAQARFTVVANHFKSKSCGDAAGADADAGDGQGCFNARRVSQANALLSFIDSIRTASADPDVFVVGDLNAYAKEDPITVLTASGLVNLVERSGGPEAYSYAFDGQWGYLDHALATTSAAAQVTGAYEFHINADEPSVLDYNTDFKTPAQVTSLYAPDAYRTSDHDPVLVGLQLTTPASVPASNRYTTGLLMLVFATAVGLGARRKRLA